MLLVCGSGGHSRALAHGPCLPPGVGVDVQTPGPVTARRTSRNRSSACGSPASPDRTASLSADVTADAVLFTVESESTCGPAGPSDVHVVEPPRAAARPSSVAARRSGPFPGQGSRNSHLLDALLTELLSGRLAMKNRRWPSENGCARAPLASPTHLDGCRLGSCCWRPPDQWSCIMSGARRPCADGGWRDAETDPFPRRRRGPACDSASATTVHQPRARSRAGERQRAVNRRAAHLRGQ
jgi:hypothetical protein